MDILQMSISASVLIVFISLLRILAINKLPKLLFLILWGIVLCRLLLPISFPLLPNISTPFEALKDTDNQIEKITTIHHAVGNVVANYKNLTDNIGISVYLRQLIQPNILTIIWLSGSVLLFVIISVISCRSKRELQTALPLKGNHPYISDWMKRHPLRRSIQILSFDRINTPLTCGLFRPKIILPKSLHTENASVMNYILTHEYMHIKYFDLTWKFVAAIVLCLHWFNPLVWIMYVFLNRDLEIVCDERVIKKLGADNKGAYALCLLDVADQKRKFTPLYNGFSKNATQERIVSIMKFKKASLFTVVVSSALVLGAMSAFAANSGEEGGGDVLRPGEALEIQATENHDTSLSSSTSTQEAGEGTDFNYDSLKDYIAYGLTYDKKEDRFLFHDKQVRLFVDKDIKNEGRSNNFYYDARGKSDFKVIRDDNNKVIKITEVNESELQALSKTFGFTITDGILRFD
ncbi:UNVERIFIED_CONTAM: bla regulator protein BlaR1 [Paenibacillus sp. PvR008]